MGCNNFLGPPVVPFSTPFLREGSPTKIDYRKKGTLILASLLEDLVLLPVLDLHWQSYLIRSLAAVRRHQTLVKPGRGSPGNTDRQRETDRDGQEETLGFP